MSFKTDMFIMTGKGAPEESVDKYKRDNRGKDLDREWTYQEVWDELFNSGNVLPQPLTEAHRVVIVDADMVVYRVSAACETRSVTTTVEGIDVEFPTRTLLKEYCVSVDVDYKDLVVADKYVNEPVSHCLATLKKTVRNIYRELNATHVVFFLGGSGNFRLDLPLPTQYKAARKDLHRPLYLKACREFLNKYYDTYIVKGAEADDCVVGITSYIINNTSAWGTAVNMDKDFETTLTKNRYYHLVNKNMVELDGGIGELVLNKGKLRGNGLQWTIAQLTLGDSADGYCPKQFFRKRFGDTSHYNIFKDCKTEKDLLSLWVKTWKGLLVSDLVYQDWRGNKVEHSWLTLAEMYFSCLYMRTNPNDNMTVEKLLNKYGVVYEK